jgi:DNA-binding transcriptional ArsR family regulator
MTPNKTELAINRTNHRQKILSTLADPDSRSILSLISKRPMTAAELTETMEVPLSTTYRKINRLLDTPLVDAEYRLESDGKPPRQYLCKINHVRIQLPQRNDRSLKISVS